MGKYMTVAQMGELLGLKKTDSYWLIHKKLFETKKLAGKTVVVVSSFENWYANQVKYRKINGTEPGLELRKRSYSARDISILLKIHEQTAYDLIRKADMKTILFDGWKRVPKEEFDRWLSSQSRYRLHDFSSWQSERKLEKSAEDDAEKIILSSSEGAAPEDISDSSNSVESRQNRPKSAETWQCRSKSPEIWQSRPNSVVVKQNETDGAGLKQSCPENVEISKGIPESRRGYFTRKEAAAFAGVSESLIYLWAAEGHFSERKVGKKKYIPEGEFKAWLAQRREGGNSGGVDHKKKRQIQGHLQLHR